MKHWLLFLMSIALMQSASFAQTIEFDPPAAANPQLDAFTIVFNDGVSLDEAQGIVDAIQPIGTTIKFSDVEVFADADRMLTDHEAAVLMDNERVISFRIESGRRGILTKQSRFRVIVSVDARFTAYEARKVAAQVPVLRITEVRKNLNEIEVRLESESPETVAALEELPQVKYVAYLAAG